MTSYSVLSSDPRFTVLATWPGVTSDCSVKVTTVTDAEQADDLAYYLTRLSEGAWDAAPWLDTFPVIEAGITMLIESLRGTEHEIAQIDLSRDGYRHVDEWSFSEVSEALMELPSVVTRLTRAQRLTIADELALDAAGRAEALQCLPAGEDPAMESSRAWQVCEITRSRRNGLFGPLPEGGAGWMARAWGGELSLVERWAARNRLTRIEQLVAACRASGGRASAEEDPELCAHLVVARGKPYVDDEVFYVIAPSGHTPSRLTSPNAPMVISRSGHLDHESDVLATLDPGDDNGFARILGDWTRLVPWSRRQVPAVDRA